MSDETAPESLQKPYVLLVLDTDTGEVSFEYGNGIGRDIAIAVLREATALLSPVTSGQDRPTETPFTAPVSPFRTEA